MKDNISSREAYHECMKIELSGLNHKQEKAIEKALDAIKKLEKIEEITNKWKEYRFISGVVCMDKITEIVENG